MLPATEPSISSLITVCDRQFKILIKLSACPCNNDNYIKALDEHGRLRVWSGNFGASRNHNDSLSLDFRLQNTPFLQREVVNQLQELSDVIQAVVGCISGKDKSTQKDPTSGISTLSDDLDSDSDSDSDGFWEELKSEDTQHSQLEECWKDVHHAITSLYKLSLALLNPAGGDRTPRASQIDVQAYLQYDIRCVANFLGFPESNALVQRLGAANNKRRQLLAYYKTHSDKPSSRHNNDFSGITDNIVSPYPDTDGLNDLFYHCPGDLQEAHSDFENRTITDNLDFSGYLYADFPDWTDQYPTHLQEAHSGFENRSPPKSSPSILANNPPSTAPLESSFPEPSKRAQIVCPHCFQTVRLEIDSFDEDWESHVRNDLKPYVCTFGDCVNPNRLYNDHGEWSSHERLFHRREWLCGLCSYISTSKDCFSRHLKSVHFGSLSDDQCETVLGLSERAISSSQQCPLCVMPPITDPSCFQRHLGLHLEQLSHLMIHNGGIPGISYVEGTEFLETTWEFESFACVSGSNNFVVPPYYEKTPSKATGKRSENASIIHYAPSPSELDQHEMPLSDSWAEQKLTLRSIDVESMYSRSSRPLSSSASTRSRSCSPYQTPSSVFSHTTDVRLFKSIETTPFRTPDGHVSFSFIMEIYSKVLSSQPCSTEEILKARQLLPELRMPFSSKNSNESSNSALTESSLYLTETSAGLSSSTGDNPAHTATQHLHCPVCKHEGKTVSISSLGLLKRHFGNTHDTSEVRFRCPVRRCQQNFSKWNRAREHLRLRHIGRSQHGDPVGVKVAPPDLCPICRTGISSWSMFWQHLLNHPSSVGSGITAQVEGPMCTCPVKHSDGCAPGPWNNFENW